MFSEAYFVFSVGNIKPLQQAMYPSCFKTYKICDEGLVKSINYIQISGIIVGMLLVGALADVMGRALGSKIVSTVMLCGGILLTFSAYATPPLTYLNFFLFCLFFFGFGVGGEYPLASSSAAERSETTPELRKLRGQTVVLTFSNQGMGNVVNTIVIIIGMAMFGQTHTLTPHGAKQTIILQYGIGTVFLLFMTIWRWTQLHENRIFNVEKKLTAEAERAAEKKSEREKSAGRGRLAKVASNRPRYLRALRWYWPRLLATSMGWVANDFAFYGNKIFLNEFIALLYPHATAMTKFCWTLLNNTVALTGYYFAAYFVDKAYYGRVRMQNIGFLWMTVLFGACAIFFTQLTDSTSGLHAFQFLYFFSSFWNQFGPNCTTWLVAGEPFPLDVRASFHGISAAMGKLGAIIADIIFGYVSKQVTFVLSAVFGLVGFIVTFFFLPEMNELELEELDRMNKYILTEEFSVYHGEAINPKHLSWFERHVWGWHKNYNLEKDRLQQEIQEENEMVDVSQNGHIQTEVA